MSRRATNWKHLQEQTFTKWFNNVLRGHKKTSDPVQIENLQTDLKDGLILVQLLESLSKEKMTGVHRRPNFEQHKIENLNACFRFMEKANIKLVNIGNMDIYNGNLKLILGLIWTLIRRFQIRSMGIGLSTKEALLAWVNTQIPDQNVKNFTTDWNDGIALCALVDRIKPGLCPHYATLKSGDGLENCMEGMNLAENELGILPVMEPDDLCHPQVDELSVMTYISSFCKPANDRLLEWIQSIIPDRNITNFNKDWNNGVNLSCLLNALLPDTIPDYRQLDPHQSLDNLVHAMKIGEEHLGIKPVVTPAQLADPKVDELNVATYLSRFQYAKPIPQPHAISCKGHGIFKAIVGRPAVFEADTSKGGVGELSVTITDAKQNQIEAELTPKEKGVTEVMYIPQSAGKLTVEVKWSNSPIPGSPFHPDAIDLGAFSFTGKQITGGQSTVIGSLVIMEAKGISEVSDLYVLIQHSDGHTETAKSVLKDDGMIECTYTPTRLGKDEIFAKVAGAEIPGSPFEVRVVDPSQCSVQMKDPPAGQPLSVGKQASFTVIASEANLGGIIAEVKRPGSSTADELNVVPQGDGVNVATFLPAEVGEYKISVICAEEDIRGSPILAVASDPGKCEFLDAFPSYAQVDKPYNLRLSVKGAGSGAVEVGSSQSSVLSITSSDSAQPDQYSIQFTPHCVGEASIDVKWEGMSIAPTPCAVSVCDATKCSAYGPDLIAGRGKSTKPFEFTVQTKGAGKGELVVKPRGQKATYAASISEADNGTYNVSFTTYEVGVHTVDVLWGDAHIPNSPFKVDFVKVGDASQFTVTGDGLKEAVALSPAKCLLVGPTSGLLQDDVLQVEVSNDKFKSKIVSKGEFDPKCGNAVVCVTDNDNGSYSVEYAVPAAGTYSLVITSDGSHIPGSPFKVNALASSDASKCKAFGKPIKKPNNCVVNKSLEFKVDTTDAGCGQITAIATDPSSSSIPVFTAEDKSNKAKKVYALKIDPKKKGEHKVRVLWSGVDIPGSPFTFAVGNPKDVVVTGLPDSSMYVARIKEPITFSVDPRKAGKGEIKCFAKLDSGSVEEFQPEAQANGSIILTYTPQNPGRMELLLAYNGEDILPTPWQCEITNPSSFQVIPPKDHVKQHDYAKFIVSGLTEKNKNKLKISAVHPEHPKPTIKDEGIHGSTAVYRFTAKQVGEYEVNVKIGSKHIAGSPFRVQVANPEKCKVVGVIPSALPVKTTKQFQVETNAAGSGELSFKIYSVNSRKCLDCKVLDDASNPGIQTVKLSGLECGQCNFRLQWAGFDIPKMPVGIAVVDPKKCSFTCDQIKSGLVKTSEMLSFTVNTYEGGNCPPEVISSGPKAKYSVDIKKTNEGEYTASFTPWQEGTQRVQISIGGLPLNNTPVTFEAFKPLEHSKITATGDGLKQAIANRYNKVTVLAGEPKLFERGQLAIAFQWSDSHGGDKEPVEVEIKDEQNGSYSISYKPQKTGKLQMRVTGEGKGINGSPFSIDVLPEPNAAMCRITDASGQMSYFVEGAKLYHQINTPVVLWVDVSQAGTGTLKASGKDPNDKFVRILTAEEQDESQGKRLYMLRFDPNTTGLYSLNLTWDSVTLPNCPYQIIVVDPKKCALDATLPVFLQIDQSVSINVCTTEAGDADLEVTTEDQSVNTQVERKDENNFTVTLTGTQLGKTLITMKYGGFNLFEQPHGVSVCDPKKCGFNLGKLEVQVGVPFTITIKTHNAGTADLQVKPVDPEKQYTFDVREESPDEWKAICTAWNLGEQELKVLWGEWELPGSPIKFSAVDPKKIKVIDIPDPQNYVAIIGEPISFSVDYSEAGKGSVGCYVIHSDGEREEIEGDDKDEVVSLTVTPKVPGKMELGLTFNGVDLFSPNLTLSYEVPDPSTFQVIPPKGYGKIGESVKFAVTGVTADTELSFKATHLEQEAAVQTELGKDGSNVIAEFTPQKIGKYDVEVMLKDQHIEGSPFTVKVANPESCNVIGEPPAVIHSGEQGLFEIDSSSGGPGELAVQAEVISGDIEPTVSQTEKGKWSISSAAGVGQCQLTAKWADYTIQGTPFMMQFVESGNVMSSCEGITNGSVKQGELVSIQLDASRAGQSTPEVTAIGPKSSFAVQTTNNNDGTFTLSLNPYQVGENSVTILWGGKDIPGSPFKFVVSKVIEASTIIASGEGIKAITANTPATVTINAPDSGLLDQGKPALTANLVLVGPDVDQQEVVNVDLKDTGSGSYSLTYTAPKEDDYELEILFEKQHIHGSPFKVHAFPSPKAEKCKVFGRSLEKIPYVFKVNTNVQFGVEVTGAGKGKLNITGTNPNGEQISTIFTNNQIQDGRRKKHARYTPEQVGHHIIAAKWEGVDIPGSPFDFNVIDPSKCKVEGLPPRNGLVQKDGKTKSLKFSVHCGDAGEAKLEVSVTAPNGSEAILQPAIESAPVCSYVYDLESFGGTIVSVKFGGFNVPNSPFKFTVVDPNRYSISGLNVQGKYARVSDSIVFDISSQKYSSDDVLDITMHGPKGEKDHQSLTPENGKCSHSFTPMSAGSYDIFVECSGVQVNGSPLQINVVDPHKCQIFSKFPSQFQVGIEEEIIVNTQGAGEGGLEVFFNKKKEHPSIECKVSRQDINSYVMKFNGKRVDTISVFVVWGGFNIKGSPFRVNVSDATKCVALGLILTSKTAATGEPITFSVLTKDAGKGILSVVPKGPSATYKPDIKVSEGKHDVSFTPWEVGELNIDVCWGKAPIPNSPFAIKVENSKNICNATGEGLKSAIVGQQASFTIITAEMGLLEKKAIGVSIAGVRAGRLKPSIKDNHNGTYTVSYTAQKPGAYIANITVNKVQVLGSPFKINVVSAPDASKCIVGGPALQPNAVHLSGSHLEVTVDTSEAGMGKLNATIEGPNKFRPKVYMSEGVNGLYSIKFQAITPGKYSIQLLWSDQVIPGSPFKIKVHQAPDASKVRAYGSGLEDGYVGTPGEFIVDTRHAGIGTITINVHGIKDSFKIIASRSDGDPRILTGRYDPTKKGDYVIRMLWDGVHIPRSPFVVRIKGKPGSDDSDEERKRTSRVSQTQGKPPAKATSKAKSLPAKIREQDQMVLDSSFAKAAPTYDDIPKSKKDAKATPVKVKDKKRKKSDAQPTPTVGPVAPSLKMKQNTAMAMALIAPTPRAGDVKQPADVEVITKKKVAKTIERKKVPVHTKGAEKTAASPHKATKTEGGRPTSPRGRPTSPKGQPTSPKRRPTSPQGRPTSPKPKETAKPTTAKKASPSREGGAERPAKPTTAAKSAGAKSTGAKKPTGTAKPTGAGATKATGTAKPTGSGAKPTSSSKPAGAAKPSGATKPAGATKPSGTTKPSGAAKPSRAARTEDTDGGPTSSKPKQTGPPKQRSGRPTSPVRSKPAETGGKPGASKARPTSPQPKQSTTPSKTAAKSGTAGATATSKQGTPTKSPGKPAATTKPAGTGRSPGATGAKPKSPTRQPSSGASKQPSQRAPSAGKPSGGGAAKTRATAAKPLPTGGGKKGRPVSPESTESKPPSKKQAHK